MVRELLAVGLVASLGFVVRAEEAGRLVELVVLYDNEAQSAGTAGDWGFACLVRGDEHTVLFDTGREAEVLRQNAEALGIELSGIDAVVLSHTHGDHTGGLATVLSENPGIPVYVPRDAPDALQRAIEKGGGAVVHALAPTPIAPGITTTGSMGSQIREQALLVGTAQGVVVVTGCAHPGVVEMVRRGGQLSGRDVHTVAGGFHLRGHSLSELREIVQALQQLGVDRVAPCHCTGEEAEALLKRAYKAQFVEVGAGTRITFR
jgi:7,8-dihydropterin-6-yl-methyl-4-(beta-D-ribofuranosyl)aminobenzene 5'-phosphate synthase